MKILLIFSLKSQIDSPRCLHMIAAYTTARVLLAALQRADGQGAAHRAARLVQASGCAKDFVRAALSQSLANLHFEPRA
jgi:hypothetical protein